MKTIQLWPLPATPLPTRDANGKPLMTKEYQEQAQTFQAALALLVAKLE